MYQLFEKSELGSLKLKNRIIRSATNEHLSDAEGNITPELMQAYLDIAKGGSGMLITGHYSVDRECRSDKGQAVVDDRLNCALLTETIKKVHEYNCVAIMQLSHPGNKAMVCQNGKRACKPADRSVEELQDLRSCYIRGAELAKQCGFDGVQVHLAHGYFLSGMMDPVENERTDEYGGPVANRFRLAAEIIDGIKKACGEDFAVLVKLNCNSSDLSAPYTNDLREALQLCKQSGVLLAEISGNNFAGFEAKVDAPYYMQELLAVEPLPLPVALVGGLDSRQKLEQALQAGIPYVSLSRSLICDPDFVNKLQSGEADRSACLRCRGCYKCYATSFTRCVLHKEPMEHLKQLFG